MNLNVSFEGCYPRLKCTIRSLVLRGPRFVRYRHVRRFGLSLQANL
jgi:hypothetical protein